MITDLIGVPFEYEGRTREGADCVGLVLLAQQELGREGVVDLWAYFLEQAGATDWEALATGWHQGLVPPPPGWTPVGDWPLPFVELQPGDVIEHDAKLALAHVSTMAEGGWVLVTSRAVGASYLVSWGEFCARAKATAPSRVWRISQGAAA